MPQRGVVLDDAVMDERQLAGLVQVRVGVGVAGQAVGGPARMADAEGPVTGFALEQAGQPRDAADAFAHLQLRRPTSVQMPAES